MILSPPFLPPRAAGTTEDTWLDQAMAQPTSRLPCTEALEGSFPLSYNLAWHNGIHLQAPQVGGANLAARAIADGEVVFASEPVAVNGNVDHAQNYNPFDPPDVKTAAWSDNGCVILQHKTEIGADGTTPTELVYYSLYMHLSSIARIAPAPGKPKRSLQKGDAIWRKDEVGTAGQIYGHTGQIHFEICLDAANLQQLIGRTPDWVEPAVAPAASPAPTADGRTDSVFGSLYVYLPATTPTDTGTSLPKNHLRRTGGTTLGTALWVRMTYDLGGCTFETFDERGRKVSAMPTEPDVEYELYKLANARHDSLAAPAAGAPSTSSPSGWYELLRFGRNLGRGPAASDKDPLPSNAAHWRRIADASGQKVWADLNASGSFKFSDADFLPAMGWNCIQDDTSPNDQRCDSANLKNLVRDPDAANTRRMETNELARRIGEEAVKQKLRRAICKFPSEWDRASVKARYGFVQEFEGFKRRLRPWPNLVKHLEALSFDDLPQGFKEANWRVHPREFVGVMRRCGWLSLNEAIQLFPRSALRKTGSATWANEPVNFGRQILENNLMPLNRAAQKYCITTAQRLSAFFGNAMQETQWFALLAEGGGPSTRYAPWYGRGFLQLTWPVNYIKYARFRGMNISLSVETQLKAAQKSADVSRNNATLQTVEGSLPHDLATFRNSLEDLRSNQHAPSDSAGAYWAWSQANLSADPPAAFKRVAVTASTGAAVYYTHQSFGHVAATVNVGHPSSNFNAIYGVQARFQAYVSAAMILMDCEQFPDAQGQLKCLPDGYVRRLP